MRKLWICLALLCTGITASKEFNPVDADNYYDYINSDGDYVFPSSIDSSSGEIDLVKTSKSGDEDLVFPEFINKLSPDVNGNNNLPTDLLSGENVDSVKTTKSIDDYTILNFINELNKYTDENDNLLTDSAKLKDLVKTTRSSDEDIISELINDLNENKKSLEEVNDYQVEDNRSIVKDENNSNKDEYSGQNFIESDDSFDWDIFNDNVDKKSLSDEINEELNEEFNESNINNEEQNVTNKPNSEESIQQIIDDTRTILSEDPGNDFAEYSLIKDEANKNITTDYKKIIDETKLLLEETRGALDEQNIIENAEDIKDSISNNNENEENYNSNKYNKGNDLIADLVELKEIRDKLNEFDNESDDIAKEKEDIFGSEENNDYEELDDTNLDQIFNNNDTEKIEDTVNIHEVEPFPDDSLLIEQTKKSDPILYHNDDLLASDIQTHPTEKAISPTETTKLATGFTSEDMTKGSNEFTEEEVTKSSENIIDTKNMTDLQIDHLLKDFSNKNLKNLVSNAKSSNNVIRVLLSVDKPTVINSIGYPNPYPTNTITDWIFEGIGTGIEFNVTDCAINGHVGDYLLVKPGGIDESGHDGLIFTYTLNTERLYRFFDVDRMFMRFESKMGMPFMRGFSISARMLVPPPIIDEPKPDPLPSVQYPEHTLTLNLGGISLEGFIKVEEEFRQIIADMATMYINANDINPGLNSTLDVTQITSKAMCYHNWPQYEMCAEVRFGVPLILEEEETSRLDEDDLLNMWSEYSTQDPFAVRLRILGITEFQVPNNNGVLLVWLVIAGGVVISMAMLAFALWRFSCFDDYTRMPSYSDTDSLNEKRKMDMFPTPHQTLPPLYTDADYKWVDNEEQCKVDIGGYSNRNFLEDDMFDIDSEDDVVSGRNRDKSIRPRDIYSV